MARKVKTEKKKKKSKIKIIIVIILLLLVCVGGFFGYKKFFKKEPNKKPVAVKVLDHLEEYGYSISDRDTKYYKEEFESLKKLLNSKDVDEKEYATFVARLFVNDLYTMSSKINKYDVGGTEFYYKDNVTMFNKKVMDTIYATLLDDTYGDRKQDLIEVNNVETVSVEETNYLVGNEKVDGYLVKLKWTYVSDMGYDDEGSVVVVKEHEGPRWSVVDFQPTLNPKYESKK